VLVLLLKTPSDDSVEVAIAFVKEVGATLEDGSKSALHHVMERFRSILHEGTGVSKRTQYQIEGMFAVRKAGFEAQGFVAVKPELDLVEEDDQIEHDVRLH
jgi:pre-mRNA-splicing factor CWC22